MQTTLSRDKRLKLAENFYFQADSSPLHIPELRAPAMNITNIIHRRAVRLPLARRSKRKKGGLSRIQNLRWCRPQQIPGFGVPTRTGPAATVEVTLCPYMHDRLTRPKSWERTTWSGLLCRRSNGSLNESSFPSPIPIASTHRMLGFCLVP